MDKNYLLLQGHMCKDAVISSNTNTPSVRFTLAVNRKGENAGADFVPCVAFKKPAEIIQAAINNGIFHKGTELIIEGSFKTGSYMKNNETIYTYECLVNTVDIIIRNTNNSSGNSNGTQNSPFSGNSQGNDAFANSNNQQNGAFANQNQNTVSNNTIPPQNSTQEAVTANQTQNAADTFAAMGSGLPWG